MEEFTWYAVDSGEITGYRSGVAVDSNATRGHGERLIPGRFDGETHYVDVSFPGYRPVLERQPLPYTVDKVTAAVGELVTVTLPIIGKIRVDQDLYETDLLEIDFDTPATYVIHLEAFPYLPTKMEVTIT